MRKIIEINNGWYYKSDYQSGLELQDDLEGFEKINLPHTNIEVPYNYFDEEMFQFTSCYKYPLNIPKEFKNKIIYLHFEGVMAYARVYLNGHLLGEHKGGYTPFRIRIDQAYSFETETNMLTVIVDSTELEGIPPFGGQIDYL
ncbi:MAG TPA: beta-galactosidase, partial [Firmicutes bacterium]|nr:beta-galactosidase [Bacillota bacterium]